MIPEAFRGLVDDAAVFPPGDAPLPEALAAYVERRSEWYADLVGSFVVTDVAVPEVGRRRPRLGRGDRWCRRDRGSPQARGQARPDSRRPGDRPARPGRPGRQRAPGLGRRRCSPGEGIVDDATPVYVELPQSDATPAWLAAADVVAEGEHRLKFRTGGLEADRFPTPDQLAGWIDAASTGRRRSSAPPACTTPSPTATTNRVPPPRLPQRAARDAPGVRRSERRRGRDPAGRPLPQRPGRPGPHRSTVR